MKLTPLRVRGKRGASTPKKRASSTAPSKRRKLANGDKSKHVEEQTATPRLEHLPVEVLVRILVESRNLSLPLCCRRLYHKLSGDYAKQELVVSAFGPTWDKWFGIAFPKGPYSGLDVGDSIFQSAVLACSWAKLEFILSSYEAWIRGHALGRPFVRPNQLLEQALRDKKIEDEVSILDPARSPAMQMREFVLGVKANFERDPRWPVMNQTFSPHIHVHPGVHIPDKLITGPFDKDMADRLFWAVYGSARLDYDSQTWELTTIGFRNILEVAVHDLDLARYVMHLFNILRVLKQWPSNVIDDASKWVEEAENRPATVDVDKGEYLAFLDTMKLALRDMWS